MINERADFISKINHFHEERLRVINSKKTPVPLFDGARMALHIMPIAAFSSHHMVNINLTQLQQETLFQQHQPLYAVKANSHRYLFYCTDHSANTDRVANAGVTKQKMYIQLFRSGIFEFVMAGSHEAGIEKMELPARVLGSNAIQFLKESLSILGKQKVEPPYYLFLSFLKIHGYKLALTPDVPVKQDSAVFDREGLFLPGVLIENRDVDPEQVLRPLLDMLWYTFYEEACLDYGKDGKWIKQPQQPSPDQ